MIVSHKHKFIFLAVAKTGTTSIEKVLNGYVEEPFFTDDMADNMGHERFDKGGWITRKSRTHPLRKHTSAQELKAYLEEQGWDWDSYFKFGFVRNPWSKILSQYYFILEQSRREVSEGARDWDKFWIKDCQENMAKHPDFNTYASSYKWEMTPLLMVDGKFIDFIGRFENLQVDFNYVCDRIGIPRQTLPVTNKTKHGNYHDYYNDESREAVRRNFETDIKNFGYEFYDA